MEVEGDTRMKCNAKRNRRRLCQGCGERWARFRYDGRVRWDRAHTLCFRCWRSAFEQVRSLRLATVPAAA